MSDFVKEIQATNEAFVAAFAAQDAAKMATVYTEDGQALPPNSAIVAGRPALQAMWQGVMNMGIQAATLETVELEQQGDLAVEVGKYALTVAGGQVADEGKYIVIWRRDKGHWLWHRDIWNSSRPAAS
jgi:uncharacterized protein (TIGR02246 family)